MVILTENMIFKRVPLRIKYLLLTFVVLPILLITISIDSDILFTDHFQDLFGHVLLKRGIFLFIVTPLSNIFNSLFFASVILGKFVTIKR